MEPDDYRLSYEIDEDGRLSFGAAIEAECGGSRTGIRPLRHPYSGLNANANADVDKNRLRVHQIADSCATIGTRLADLFSSINLQTFDAFGQGAPTQAAHIEFD